MAVNERKCTLMFRQRCSRLPLCFPARASQSAGIERTAAKHLEPRFTFIHVYSRLLAFLILSASAFAQMQNSQTAWKPEALKKVGIDQKMGVQVPLDVPFTDERGQPATLRQYLGKPVVLAMVYYQCPSLCDMILTGVVRTARSLKMTVGDEFGVVAVSFDPHETPEMAVAKKAAYMKEYQRPGSERGWHFLTGPEASSRTLADVIGFHYAYDSITNQYAHASAIVILTPEGRTTRYFYGIDYPERDVRLALVEASRNRIGSVVDQVMLYCYHWDPARGKYGMVIMNVIRIAGFLTVGCLFTFLIVMFGRDFRAARAQRHLRIRGAA
jgi:protein SCO1/2